MKKTGLQLMSHELALAKVFDAMGQHSMDFTESVLFQQYNSINEHY
jgi:hypothetical protein